MGERALAIVDVEQRHRWSRKAQAVTPNGSVRFEPVEGEKSPPMFGDEIHRLDDVLELVLANEIVEVDPDPARFYDLTTFANLRFDEVARIEAMPRSGP